MKKNCEFKLEDCIDCYWRNGKVCMRELNLHEITSDGKEIRKFFESLLKFEFDEMTDREKEIAQFCFGAYRYMAKSSSEY